MRLLLQITAEEGNSINPTNGLKMGDVLGARHSVSVSLISTVVCLVS